MSGAGSGRRVTGLIAAVLLATTGTHAQVSTSSTLRSPSVTVFASGVNGPGWWGLKIDTAGRMRADIVGGTHSGAHAPLLTGEERERLAALLAALPTKLSKYSYGKHYDDVSMTFELTIGTGKEARKYAVTDSLDDGDAKRPEVRAILEALHFLHSLLGSKEALPPPPIERGPGAK